MLPPQLVELAIDAVELLEEPVCLFAVVGGARLALLDLTPDALEARLLVSPGAGWQ